MRCEIPECARCCFCFPLRFGLLVWAYTKLVFIGLILVWLFDFLVNEIIRNGYFITNELPMYIIAIIFTMFFCVDIIFHIIFIISAHMKEYGKMKLFYKEALFGLGLYVFGLFFSIVYLTLKYNIFGLIFGHVLWCLFFWLIITQVYLIILVRSEVMKLERNSNLQFTNHAADDESTKVDTNISLLVE